MAETNAQERRQVVIYLTFQRIGEAIDAGTATPEEEAAHDAYIKSAACTLMALLEEQLGREWLTGIYDACLASEKNVPLSALHNPDPNHDEMM